MCQVLIYDSIFISKKKKPKLSLIKSLLPCDKVCGEDIGLGGPSITGSQPSRLSTKDTVETESHYFLSNPRIDPEACFIRH